MKRKPRPICPKCCSADVAAGKKSSKCNRCGYLAPADRFKTNGIVSGGLQSFSTQSPRHPRNLPDHE